MKISQSRKAVAPVIATLLMIAVAVAMSVIIFMWSQGFLSQTSSSTGGQQGSQNQAAQSSISIELATFTACPSSTCAINSSPQLVFVVRNVGAVAVTLGSITITGLSSNSGFKGTLQTATMATGSTVMTGTDSTCTGSTNGLKETATAVALNKGSSSTITIVQSGAALGQYCQSSNQLFSGDVLSVKVTTNVGTFAQSQFTVP